jgi:hypothetical protein
MPPRSRPRPEQPEAELFSLWLDDALSRDGQAARATVRRLNRGEYNNTTRDLVGVHFRPADDFPADDTGDGFDTIAGVLSVSPTLIEKYLLAAEDVVESAANDAQLWRRLSTPPATDSVPYVLRGAPPQRNDAVKATARAPADEQTTSRAAEIDRVYYALQAFADRAYRRPITHAEMYRLMRFVEAALNNGETADAGLKLALKAVLVSPHFLFRVERDPDPVTSDFELASRLSYFLWSSMPDEELFRLAAGGQLRDARTLVRQVRRMLRDPRSRALAEHFGGSGCRHGRWPNAPRTRPCFPGSTRSCERRCSERRCASSTSSSARTAAPWSC